MPGEERIFFFSSGFVAFFHSQFLALEAEKMTRLVNGALIRVTWKSSMHFGKIGRVINPPKRHPPYYEKSSRMPLIVSLQEEGTKSFLFFTDEVELIPTQTKETE